MLYSLYSISFVHLEVVAGFVPEPSCKHHAVLPLLGHLPHLRTEVTATPWQSDTDLALSICVNLLDEPYHILAYPNIILYTCVCVACVCNIYIYIYYIYYIYIHVCVCACCVCYLYIYICIYALAA